MSLHKSEKWYYLNKMMMKYTILIAMLLFLSCDSSSENQGSTDLVDGWQSFENKNYQQAINHFKNVISSNSNQLDAYVGLGYSYMFLNDYFNSTLTLNQALNLDDTNVDVIAALVFVLNAEGLDLNNSNLFADQLITLKPDWSFGHQLNITLDDVYLVQAQNYYILANFSASLSRLQLVDTTFSADINTEAGIIALGIQIESLNPGL